MDAIGGLEVTPLNSYHAPPASVDNGLERFVPALAPRGRNPSASPFVPSCSRRSDLPDVEQRIMTYGSFDTSEALAHEILCDSQQRIFSLLNPTATPWQGCWHAPTDLTVLDDSSSNNMAAPPNRGRRMFHRMDVYTGRRILCRTLSPTVDRPPVPLPASLLQLFGRRCHFHDPLYRVKERKRREYLECLTTSDSEGSGPVSQTEQSGSDSRPREEVNTIITYAEKLRASQHHPAIPARPLQHPAHGATDHQGEYVRRTHATCFGTSSVANSPFHATHSV